MTYTSEIGLCLTKEAHDEMVDCLDLEKVLEGYPGNSARRAVQKIFASANCKLLDNKTGSVLYHWDALRWHHGLEDVQLIKSFLAMLDEEHYLFVKIGEKFDDLTQEGVYMENPFGLHMSRCIHFG